MPERFECEVLQQRRYINTLTFTFSVVKLDYLLDVDLETDGRHILKLEGTN